MSAENTLEALVQYCRRQTGTDNAWNGKSGHYQWNVGRFNSTGIINGVVRKLAGTDSSGRQIWVVAGSFKINSDGSILRFTGISKKDQNLISRVSQVQTQAQTLAKTEQEA